MTLFFPLFPGSISWKKYISGIALLSEEVRDDEAIKLAFKLFDQNDDGRIEQDELFAYARTATHTRAHLLSPAPYMLRLARRSGF
jgi:Ca2+-binding EF-hand superfamily protein